MTFIVCFSMFNACAQSHWDTIKMKTDGGLEINVITTERNEDASDEQEENRASDFLINHMSQIDMNPKKDQEAPTNIDSLIDMTLSNNPCLHIDCGMHGVCVTQGQQGSCACDDRYEFNGLSCIPEDVDQDGVNFTVDCDDSDAQTFPQATEICDEIDQDCDSRIDEGACSIWVLEPLANRWSSYPLNPNGSASVPIGPMKAAWDIENQDIAFVLTENGYHEFRISSMAWSPQRPITDVLEGFSGAIHHAVFADSVPAHHGQTIPMPLGERITISMVDAQGIKRVWQIKYLLDENRFVPKENGLYNEVHSWREIHAPEADQVRASWIDLENNRFILNVNTQDLCGRNEQISNIYLGILTPNQLHVLESGICFQFVPPLQLMNSPLDLPNAPSFNDVGAAFMHQGALYLFRGD